MSDVTLGNEISPFLLQGKNICKDFWMNSRKIEVLKDLSIELREGDSVSIVGASGQGKSTLLQILGTLDSPTSGELSIGGKDIFSLQNKELELIRNEWLGFVFQSHYLLPEFSALENVMMPALIKRMSQDEAHSVSEELLQWVGLKDRISHRPGELSGGERQRVALCRALVLKPRLLLADEPTGNLDFQTGADIHSLLHEVNEKWNTTLLVVTHNLELASQMKKCLHLQKGTLIEKPTEKRIGKE